MESQTFRILVVEDQTMFRTFLAEWLSSQKRFVLAGAAGSAEAALDLVESARPDIVMVDLQLPGMDGLQFARAARQLRPHLRALILSSLTDPLTLTRVRESGVEGYVEKDATLEQLALALNTLADGNRFFSRNFNETLAREGTRSQSIGKILSRREQEVLSHVLAGKTSKEIGDIIGLSPRTVEFHRSNIMAKLGAGSLADLVASARQRGLA